MRTDVATCALDDRVADVAPRIAASPYGFALVLAEGGVLLGRVRRSALPVDPGTPVEQCMEPGPSTVRYDTPAAELARRLREKDLRTAIVTNPEGRLLGVVTRSDLEARVAGGAVPLVR